MQVWHSQHENIVWGENSTVCIHRIFQYNKGRTVVHEIEEWCETACEVCFCLPLVFAEKQIGLALHEITTIFPPSAFITVISWH